VAQAALQQLGEVAAEQDRDQDRGAHDRDGEQHLKRRLGDELNREPSASLRRRAARRV